MAKIDMKTGLNVAPDEVWKLIGGFKCITRLASGN